MFSERQTHEDKKVINKLYKTIYINPDLLFTNIDVLKNYINIEDYLNNDNYTLLKVNNLDKKISYIINKYNVKTYDNITKCLIKEVYDNKDRNICSPEEIGYKNGWLKDEQLEQRANLMGKNTYGKNLARVLRKDRK